MNIITEPEVYMVGKQTVVEEELDRFLADHNVSTWETDTEVAGQKLVEVGGRVCYMSFSKPRPGGNKAYLDHIIEVGHGCYDVETEVLTSAGWKAWPNVTMKDRLATLNTAGSLQYRKPTRLVAYHHNGRMYRVAGNGVDLLVTPDHRMFVCHTTTRQGRQRNWSDYRLTPVSQLDNRACAYLKTSIGWTPEGISLLGADELRFLGFAVGDGYYPGAGNKVQFRLRRERKIAWLRSLLKRLGWGWTKNGDHFSVDAEPVQQYLSLLYTVEGEKQIPDTAVAGGMFTHQTRDELEGLFEGLMQSDWSDSSTGSCFDTTSRKLADQFQQLCLHIGLAANEGTIQTRDSTSYGDKPVIRLHVIRRNLHPEVNKWTKQAGHSSWIDGWDGEVFCAEMPEDTMRVVYVRRNGQPVWSGNSVLEHAAWNFIITGVSRSFTHELVRHRAGWAYSQLSQRYVDESVAEYIVPHDLRDEVEAAQYRRITTQGSDWQDMATFTTALASNKRWNKFTLAQFQAMADAGEAWLKSVEHAHSAYTKLADYLSKKGPATLDCDVCDGLGCHDGALKCSKCEGTGKSKWAPTDVRKFARQAARSVLPNATETKIFVTANARSLRHFIEMRASRFAEPEIRKVAVAVLKIMQKEAPGFFGDYTLTSLPDGTFEANTAHRKV